MKLYCGGTPVTKIRDFIVHPDSTRGFWSNAVHFGRSILGLASAPGGLVYYDTAWDKRCLGARDGGAIVIPIKLFSGGISPHVLAPG